MADLKSLDSTTKVSLKTIDFSQKEEYWFNVKFIISSGELIELDTTIHINDFVALLEGIEALVDKKVEVYKFEPTEPHIRINFTQEESGFGLKIFYCKGPVFNETEYSKMAISVTAKELNKFAKEVKKEIKSIDSNIKFQEISF